MRDRFEPRPRRAIGADLRDDGGNVRATRVQIGQPRLGLFAARTPLAREELHVGARRRRAFGRGCTPEDEERQRDEENHTANRLAPPMLHLSLLCSEFAKQTRSRSD
jgi:hypothetical protein